MLPKEKEKSFVIFCFYLYGLTIGVLVKELDVILQSIVTGNKSAFIEELHRT